MFFYEGQACPVCGQHFAQTDDIVTCPRCGAPHHRACWMKEGHCHFEADHGTEREWGHEPTPPAPDVKEEPSVTRRCPNCGFENPEYAEFCSRCGREIDPVPPPQSEPYTPPFGGGFSNARQMPFSDPYGGVDRNASIDGVPVETLVGLIGPNSSYYLPRFLKMDRENTKMSWNWAAFLIPYNWMLYRKQWLTGGALFLFSSILKFFNILAMDSKPMQTFQQLASKPETAQTAMQMLSSGELGVWLLILSLVSVVGLAVSVLAGLFGNYLYMQHVLKQARKLQEDPDSVYHRNFFEQGGVSFALAIAPELISLFVNYIILIVQSL